MDQRQAEGTKYDWWRRNARRYRLLALTDDVVDIPNGRAFRTDYAARLRRYTTTGRPFALVELDLNDFGRFNKRHGRAAGNFALVAFVTAVRRRLRRGDTLYRLHGDEFAAILDVETRDMLNMIVVRLQIPVLFEFGCHVEHLSATAAGLLARARDLTRLESNVSRALCAAKRQRAAGGSASRSSHTPMASGVRS
jgi:diguanylate cyclase (GGDEF)-like protein